MGEFEQLVLLAILRLGNEAYGMEIREEIEKQTGRDVSYGAVYTTLDRLSTKAYGMEIREEIEKQTGRDVSYGAVYTTLDRLATKAYVAHELGDPTPERGGRARKYFRVEASGREALRDTRRALTVMWEGVSI